MKPPERSRRRWPLAFAALVAVLAMSGCGGGGGGGDESAKETGTTGTTAPTQTEPTQTEPTRRINPADQKRAEAMVLQLSDFPTGWRGTPDKKDDDSSVECFQVDQGDVVITGRKASDDFSTGSTTQASSLGAVYESVADAETIYEQISDGRLADCFAEYGHGISDRDVLVRLLLHVRRPDRECLHRPRGDPHRASRDVSVLRGRAHSVRPRAGGRAGGQGCYSDGPDLNISSLKSTRVM